eukprot:602775-Hanusia_phi.AAC.3
MCEMWEEVRSTKRICKQGRGDRQGLTFCTEREFVAIDLEDSVCSDQPLIASYDCPTSTSLFLLDNSFYSCKPASCSCFCLSQQLQSLQCLVLVQRVHVPECDVYAAECSGWLRAMLALPLISRQAGFKYVRSWSNNLTSLPSLALRGFHRSLVGRLTLRNRRKLGVPLMSSGGAGGAEEKLGVFFRKESDRQALVDRLHESDRLILNTDAGPEEATSARGFDVNKFFSHLSTRQLGNTVIYNHSLASTQELMMSTLKSEAEGVVCVSDIQTSGRGRGTNSWTSPEGCLCFSFSTGVEEAKLLPFFQYVVSIAMYQAISEIGGADAKSLGVQ